MPKPYKFGEKLRALEKLQADIKWAITARDISRGLEALNSLETLVSILIRDELPRDPSDAQNPANKRP